MNRIEIKLNKLKNENKKALISYVTAGDPNLETTEKSILTMIDNGADIIQIGVPFSDPIAEGIAIQNASKRALENGVTLKKIFEMAKDLRKKTDEPLVFMMYLNTIFGFGTDKFFKLCVECGVDGIIVPDMPFEERDELQPFCEKYDVISISLVTPTSHRRIQKIAENAKGYLYCVSAAGAPETNPNYFNDCKKFLGLVEEHSAVPCAADFEIFDEHQMKELSGCCDGIITGSAAVRITEEEKENAPHKIGEFIGKIRNILDK